MFILPPKINRAIASVRSRSSVDGSGANAILRPGLGSEWLHDHFLNVAVSFVQIANREERIDPIFGSLADADQNTRRKGDR